MIKSRWILRRELFVQPGSYTIKIPSDSKETVIDIVVDESRHFELSAAPPEGILSVARPINSD